MSAMLNPPKKEVTPEQKTKLLHFLRDVMDLDFTSYSEASVSRRIAKVLSENRFSCVEDYILFLQNHPHSKEAFLEGFTVNVTEMFRDPQCFECLTKAVFPQLYPQEKTRIWSAGCSSGEEVLSLCILLKEQDMLEKTVVLATDLSVRIIEKAKTLRHKLRHVKNYQNSYKLAGGRFDLGNYYMSISGDALFDDSLIHQVDYRVHNLIKEPPNQVFDLIACRNVLIYLNANLQDKVLQNLTSRLKTGGFLMLGSKESLIFFKDRKKYIEVHPGQKIYQKTE